MEEKTTLKNIQFTTFLLFAVVGIVYLLASLMERNGILMPSSRTISRVLQLPFFLITLGHFTVQLIEPLATEEKKHKILIGIIIFLSITIFFGIVFLHFTRLTT